MNRNAGVELGKDSEPERCTCSSIRQRLLRWVDSIPGRIDQGRSDENEQVRSGSVGRDFGSGLESLASHGVGGEVGRASREDQCVTIFDGGACDELAFAKDGLWLVRDHDDFLAPVRHGDDFTTVLVIEIVAFEFGDGGNRCQLNGFPICLNVGNYVENGAKFEWFRDWLSGGRVGEAGDSTRPVEIGHDIADSHLFELTLSPAQHRQFGSVQKIGQAAPVYRAEDDASLRLG